MNEWMNNPAMKNIDPIKLELIKTAASKTSGKSGKELAPVMMALISGANKQGIRFTPEEMTLILEILKEGKSKEEREQIDRTINMASSLFPKTQRKIDCFFIKTLLPYAASASPGVSPPPSTPRAALPSPEPVGALALVYHSHLTPPL